MCNDISIKPTIFVLIGLFLPISDFFFLLRPFRGVAIDTVQVDLSDTIIRILLQRCVINVSHVHSIIFEYFA